MKTSMITSLRCALLALISLGFVSGLQAEGKEKKVPASALKKFDANKDGVLDETEKAAWQADVAKKKEAAAARKAESLAKYDTDKDGKLDASEKAAMKADQDAAKEKKKIEREKKKADKAASRE